MTRPNRTESGSVRTTLAEFLLTRLAEQYDRKPRQSWWRAALFAARRAGWSVPFVQRRMAARFADHPDYREDWKP